MRNKYLLLALLFFLVTTGNFSTLSFANTSLTQEPSVRVLISDGENKIKLTILGGYKVLDSTTNEVLSDSHHLPGVNIRSNNDSILVAGVSFPPNINIYSDDDADLYINNQPFRGYVSVHLNDQNELLVVNHLKLEEYLYGVLYHEVGSWWPMESLKTQAVAARTYAYYKSTVNRNKLFDVYNNQSSQMYGGANSERPRSNDAVDQTRGEFLTYEGKVFPTFYHATCGGMTRDASELWNINIPPLDGKVQCSMDWFSPHYGWKSKFTFKEIEKILEEHEVRIGSIQRMEVLSRSPSDRVHDIKILGSNSMRILTAKKLRLWIGPTVIRSDNFHISHKGKFIVFEGKGWGHGVGMCQWGALGLSIIRKNYDDILYMYYPGSKLAKLYS